MLGDFNGGAALTYISHDDFRILKADVIEKGNATATGRLVPNALFMSKFPHCAAKGHWGEQILPHAKSSFATSSSPVKTFRKV